MKKGQWFIIVSIKMSKINTCMFGIIPPNHINNNEEYDSPQKALGKA